MLQQNLYDVFQRGCSLGHGLDLDLNVFPGLNGFGFEVKIRDDGLILSVYRRTISIMMMMMMMMKADANNWMNSSS